MRPYIFLLSFLACSYFSQGQSFIFNQLFQPSVRFSALYSHDFNFSDKDPFHLGQANINFVVPIKSQLKLKVDWKKMLTLRFKKATKLKVYQIFWNFRPRFMYIDFKYKNSLKSNPFQNKAHFTYGFSTGITGIHLLAKPLKKPKFLFYSVNIGFLEDYKSVQRIPVPSFNFLIGVAHMKGLNFYWYYGFYFSYDNGQFIPAPFLGIQAKLSKHFFINITLPVQVKLSFKVSKKLKIDLGAGLSGFSTAFGYQQQNSSSIERYILGGFRVRTGLNFNIKLSKQAILYLEGGCFPYQFPTFRLNTPTPPFSTKAAPFAKPDVGISVYGGLSLFYSFKKALLGSTIDGIIMF